MKSRLHIDFLLFLTFFSLMACQEKRKEKNIERAFYYWKNNSYSLDSSELAQIKNLNTQKLYVKFFEVEKDPVFGAAPIAKSQLHIYDYSIGYLKTEDTVLSGVMNHLEIVPTVFIKNEVLHLATNGSLDTLADNLNFLISKYMKEKMRSYSFKEIQIDCDWTAKTKDNYFYLLKVIKKTSHKILSCTLRLYPYKYPDFMGIPPVDKATLMCYNLVNPLENENMNSILDNQELESYLKNVKKYPIHLDIALPLFSWMQVYQNNEFAGIISINDLNMKKDLKPIKPLWCEVQNDKEVGNLYLREGDKIKLEEVTEETLKKTILLLQENVSLDDTTTITLFHLDSKNLKNYTNETLNSFYSDFTE